MLIFIQIYNEEKFLAQTIRSVLSQTFKDFTLLLSDNHSTDLSPQIIEAFCSSDHRIHSVKMPKHGTSLEHGMWLRDYIVKNYSDLDFICFIGAHDLMLPRCLHALYNSMIFDQSCVIAYPGQAFIVDGHNTVIHQYPAQPQTFNANNFFQSIPLCLSLVMNVPLYGLVRFSHWKEVHLRYKCYASDHLWVSELSTKGTIKAVENAEIQFRQFSSSLSMYRSKHLVKDMAPLDDLFLQLNWLSHIIDLCKPSQDETINSALRASAYTMYIYRYLVQFTPEELPSVFSCEEIKQLFLVQAALCRTLEIKIKNSVDNLSQVDFRDENVNPVM